MFEGLLIRYWPHLLVTALAAFLLWKVGNGLYEAGENAASARYEKVIASYAKAEAEAQEKARAAERASAEAANKAVAQYEKGKEDAQSRADRVIADLGADRLRLRQQWAGCETDRLSQDTGRAAIAGEQDRLRRESLQRVLGWVGELQAQRDALIDGWNGVAGE